MLSAFTAHPIIELRPRDKSKIETILANGDRVLVGLNSGALRIYRLNEPSSPANESRNASNDAVSTSVPSNGDTTSSQAVPKPTDLLREVERFSTRAIEQLAIIKEANTIVSLSNYHVSLHDLQTFDLVETLSKTKNASCFAVTSNIVKDPDTGIPEIISRMAVAVKRNLLLWHWDDYELSDNVSKVILPESIRTITWASATKLVCGMNGGYVMVDVMTHKVEDIMGPKALGAAGQGSRFGAVSSAGMGYMGLGGYMPKPLAAKLKDGEMLLAKDINTLFVNVNGESLNKRQIPWPSAPESVGYSYPYIVALQPPSKGSLEVRNPDTLSLLQTISLPGAAQIHFPPPTVSLAHAGKGFHISSDRCVWKMGATDYDSQIEELVKNENFDEAISVLNMLEDALLNSKSETLREVKMLKAEMLFNQKAYRPAMDLMNEDDVHAPPERVLRLFPPSISGELSKWASVDENGSIKEALPKKSNGTRPTTPEEADSASPENTGTFARLWRGSHRRAPSDVASIMSAKQDSNNNGDAESIQDVRQNDRPLQGDDLKNAVLELNSYLAGTRARLQRVLDPVTGKLKPKANKEGSPEEAAEDFLRITQNETEKQLEEKLRNTFKLVDTTLFSAYMFSRPSLVGSLFRIPNFCDTKIVNEKLLEHNRYMELIDFFSGKNLHREALSLLHKFGTAKEPDQAAPNLHGPDRTIQYLQKLPPSDIDLILEYASWTLQANPAYAMEIFTGDTENAETLPRDKVVGYLRQQDTKFEMQYLDHIITELDDMTPDLQNRLVELYVADLKASKRDDAWDATMTKFVDFLRDSRQSYSLNKAFSLIPREDASFYEAQAVVLSNMGQHKQALEVYVFKMKDFGKAEEYCNRVHKSHDTSHPNTTTANEGAVDGVDGVTSSIYHVLLSLYLKPPPPHKTQLQPALDLLSRHGSRVPAMSTLDLIPDDLPVGSLESYFRGRIRSANSLVNESRIVAGLRKTEGISMASRLHLGEDFENGQGGRSRHVTITDERHCMVCHKKLGGGMSIGGNVIAVLPDNTVVHYGCRNGLNKGSARPENARVTSWGRGF